MLRLARRASLAAAGPPARAAAVPALRLALQRARCSAGAGPNAYTWERPGRAPVVVDDPDAAASRALAPFRVRAAAQQLAALRNEVGELEEVLAPLELEKVRLDALAEAYPSRFIHACFASLLALWCTMFWMVFAGMVFGPQTYFAFDWNTVEPITYFVLCASVWLAVAHHYLFGKDWTYEGLVAALAAWRRRELYSASRTFDHSSYRRLHAELDAANRSIRELQSVKGL
eukprot:TRINITY_DN46001_c0_g1_i1.p1 TRINITY_DN46001_c0_g1~~TRINITY_DN46001_c0_g1_i1.p1  ORF type:complete len:249 (+),score=59.43 TRINITY_DN46001_c0_g1_i1:60-749(+)